MTHPGRHEPIEAVLRHVYDALAAVCTVATLLSLAEAHISWTFALAAAATASYELGSTLT